MDPLNASAAIAACEVGCESKLTIPQHRRVLSLNQARQHPRQTKTEENIENVRANSVRDCHVSLAVLGGDHGANRVRDGRASRKHDKRDNDRVDVQNNGTLVRPLDHEVAENTNPEDAADKRNPVDLFETIREGWVIAVLNAPGKGRNRGVSGRAEGRVQVSRSSGKQEEWLTVARLVG